MDHKATGGYRGLRELALFEMSEDEFANLISSPDFPQPIESTRCMPLEQRRWLLHMVVPTIVLACGCTLTDSNDPALPDRGVVTLYDLS